MKPNYEAIRNSKIQMWKRFMEAKRKAELEGNIIIKNFL